MKKNKFSGRMAVAVCLTMLLVLSASCTEEKKNFKNAVSENISSVVYCKDGALWSYSDGKTLIADNVYSPESENPLFDADYAMKDGKIVLVRDGNLYLGENGEEQVLIKNVKTFRVNADLSLIAFTVGETTGELFMYNGEKTLILDSGILTDSISFSPDGKLLYALKQNAFPLVGNTLLAFDKAGACEQITDNAGEIKYVSPFESIICGSENGELMNYTVINKDKSVLLENVFMPSVSEKCKKAFFLKNYNTEFSYGTLVFVDLETLKEVEIDRRVTLFSSDTVTDSEKGIVYSQKDSDGTFSVFYKDFSSERVRLVHQTSEKTMYNVAVNSENKTAFVLATGRVRADNTLYFVSFSGDFESSKLANGYIDSLTYYEEFDGVTFVKSPEDEAEVYFCSGSGNKTKLAENTDVLYDNTLQKFSAKAVLLDRETAVYFSKDKLFLSGELIDENVSSEEFSMPKISKNEIFYCKQNGEKFDLYKYVSGEKTLIDSGIDGVVS